jgi:hypothetical protein
MWVHLIPAYNTRKRDRQYQEIDTNFDRNPVNSSRGQLVTFLVNSCPT